MDTVSNGGFLHSPRAEFFRRCPEIWPATTAPATTTSATISTRSTSINCRSKCENRALGYALNGWQVSGTVVLAQRHSVLRSEHALFGQWQWHRQRQRPAIRQRRARRAALRAQSDSRRHAARHRFSGSIPTRSSPPSIPSTGACVGGDSPANLPVRQSRAATPCAAPISPGAISI